MMRPRPERAVARVMQAAVLLAAATCANANTNAEPCQSVRFEGNPITLCSVEASADLRIFHQAPDGTPFGTFLRIEEHLAAQGQQLAFAMNGGMYHRDRQPVGLLITDGEERAPIVTADGPGNFGMRPNGVFCKREDGSYVVRETRTFAAAPERCREATQSGPMLLIGGALHPRFIPDSPSRVRRNGVGVSADGLTAHFAISDGRVNFDEFARFFRDHLRVSDALYLDGSISRLHAPHLGRSDFGLRMGPVVGVVVAR